MTLKLIEQMEETARYVRVLEAKASAAEATCEEFSRIIACFVRVHGGLIPAEVWDYVDGRNGFVSCGKRLVRDGVQITVKEPMDSSQGERSN